ncbi:MAG: type II toxin-antitoxin system VapC family toxin [Calditrichaeota bacterium]|nr:type II toxin-antitoxin system VapC family toxin [Calditrichota bacterium]
MDGILVDSNVILDLVEDDPVWGDWSESQLERLSYSYPLYINPIIYTEISIGFAHIEEVEKIIAGMGLLMLQIPKEALFLAGKVFIEYRKRKGLKTSPLPDFFIGAHAAVEELRLLTRDISGYRTYFPTVELISP